ncbi:Sec-independent protein translocase protein TatC [Neptunitalea chrysea]|uniref:Sec-independent protein translocase protein TatC n=1 Tax=Neptunitalea chrysea TaxID=1647581 RepID=A0A9W6EU31_9FLAO|nr:twin-arginine translocase subunit TatC [Neptunitalea chrysea]GLB52069.1 Sec-independent protein translocase protein TatC [Neptunitalea chrysea]
MARQPKKPADEMSFLDHLEELRWHIIRSIIAVLIIAVIAFIMKDFIFGIIILGPKDPDFVTYKFFCYISKFLGFDDTFCTNKLDFKLQNTDMAGQFAAHMWTSIWTGVVIGFPFLVYELWKFISPGLYEKERKNARGFIFVTSLLFFTGAAFGYFLISPLSINFFGSYHVNNQVQNIIKLDSYVALVRSSVLASGVIFELPIIIYFFTKIGLVTPEFLKTYRKHAIVVVLLVSAIITPPDVASQIIVSIPILILYEVSIFISAYVLKRDKKKMKNK